MSMKRYNPKEIEPKWQKTWEDSGVYRASEDNAKPKKYVLEYFPYPSGAAMHVGHVRNYTIGDAISRFNRMQGYNVLHPMGWDAFGLPAENYAIKTGVSPRQAIDQNTARFKQQLVQMGFGYDWSREIDSTDPGYYKWTQWFFLMLFKNGLAYQEESLQWWCPVDKTVLANEQVEAGKCWRCGNTVEKKALKQWFFKITDYADRLLADLDDLDWSEAIKSMQRNWIGKSKGALIKFQVEGNKVQEISVFTTRPDTLFGATFMVLAPEHPYVLKIAKDSQLPEVKKYIEASQAKSEIERQETDPEKTGVFTGAYASNPVNGKKVPIWIADYVLAGYGTGAIMAVPAHDQRDNEFAKKFKLPIINVVDPVAIREDVEDVTDFKIKKKVVAIVENNAGELLTINWGPKLGGRLFVGGTVERDESPEVTALREVTEETGYTDLEVSEIGQETYYYKYYAHSKQEAHAVDTKFIYLKLKSDVQQSQNLDESEKDNFQVEWVTKARAEKEINEPLHRYAYEKFIVGECYHAEGVMVNSGKYDSQSSSDARENILADLAKDKQGEEKINYKMRDWLISRQRYWGAPIPIIFCPKDGAVAVPEVQLPVVLPELKSFEPSGDGRSPLAKVEDFVKTTCPTCGGPAERETDTMDGFACSSWYFLRFADPNNDKKAFDAEKAKFWLPVDDYIGGAEHAVMHLLYARFWTKVMFDEGLIEFEEPFKTLRNHGMILAPDGQKMSKSKGNTIEPGELLDQGYGADSVRIMELFIGPWNQSANWSVEGMGGAFRFLQRTWTLCHDYLAEAENGKSKVESENQAELQRIIHRAIKRVSEDLHSLGFNTALAGLMQSLNDLYKLKTSYPIQGNDWRQALTTYLQLLAPFAPHITEELWQQLGQEGSIHQSVWPVHDEKYLVQANMTIVVQINGKVRANIEVDINATEDQVVTTAQANEKVASYLAPHHTCFNGSEQPAVTSDNTSTPLLVPMGTTKELSELPATTASRSSGRCPKCGEALAKSQVKKTIYVPGKLVSFVI